MEYLRYKYFNGLGVGAEVAHLSPVVIQPIKGIAASELEAYFLASHPELSSAQRFAALVAWRSNNFPSH